MAEPPGETFAAVLRRLRTQAGLSQEELAETAGVGARTVSDLERGVAQTARKDTARLLAGALGLTGADRDGFEALARGRPGGSALAGLGTGVGGVAAATRALPRDITSFTGRAAELGRLVGAVEAAMGSGGVVGIHAIGGMAGIGKTALVVHAAHRLAPRFPDGQIFLPLHGHTPGQRPVDPADALASLLQTTGVGAGQIPAGLAARMAAWRDRVAGKQLLLLLDDAAGSDQVRPLLPGTPESVVLVTSRRHLTALEDAQAISLDTLSAGEAAELLVRLATRPGLDPDDPAVAEITRLCGCLPLAVGMLARQLHHHPAWTAAELAADLATARDRLELLHAENVSVAAAFDLSYADLPPGGQRLFRRLGLHPGPDIDGYAAAALDGTDLATARRQLDGLYDHYLIGEPARGRYRLHDLIREHARALAVTDPPAERDAATGRLLDHYQEAAVFTGRLAAGRPWGGPAAGPPAGIPDVADQARALAWARAERANLLACLDHAASTGEDSRVVTITDALASMLYLDGPWPEAVTRLGAAAQAARRCGDQPGEAGALTNLAAVHILAGDYQEADQALARALGICRDLGHRQGQADALTQLGELRWVTGDPAGAAVAAEEALSIHADLGDRAGQALDLRTVGVARYYTGDLQGAAAALAEALRIHRELGDQTGEARALCLLGGVREEAGDYPGAITALQQALRIFHDLGDRNGAASAVSTLGLARAKTGDLPGAAQALGEALRMFSELGSPRSRAITLTHLATVHRQAGDLPAAAGELAEALDILGGLGDQQTEAETLNEMGTLHRVRGDLDRAADCHRTALDLARQAGSGWLEAHALAGLGRCAQAGGDPARGLASLLQALEIFQRIGAAETPAVAAELRGLTASGQAGPPPAPGG